MIQTPENQQQYGSILTILGENAEQNGKLKNKQITFTHMAIGDANDEYVQPDRKQTALVNELARIPVNSIDVLQPTPDSVPMLKVEAILPDDVNDLVIREFAAVATFDGNTYFHAIGNNARIYVPPPVNNGNVSTPVTLEMIFVITSSDPIVEIDPNVVTASREYVRKSIAESTNLMFSSVNEMKNSDLEVGSLVTTRSYYAENYDGGAEYEIVSKNNYGKEPSGIGDHKLLNGNIAVMRRDGVINAKSLGIRGDGTDKPTAIDEALAFLGGNFTIMFPDGKYSGFNNFYSNSTFIVSEGTVFEGVVHAAISGGAILKCDNVRFIGTVVTSDRVGTYDCDNVVIDAIRQVDGNRGVHFYFNTKNLYVGSIHVKGMTNADSESNKCVKIDGSPGKAKSNNIYIGTITTDVADNGAFVSLAIDAKNSEIGSVHVDKLISGGSDYDLFLVGDGASLNNYSIDKVEVNGGDNDVVYIKDVNGLKIDDIKSNADKGGMLIRQEGTCRNIDIGDAKGKGVGQNSGLSDTRRAALSLSNPLGFSLRSFLVDGIGGTNGLSINNATGDRINIGKLELRNPSLRGLVPGTDFRNIKMDELIITGSASDGIKSVSSSVLENVDIGYIQVKNSGVDGVKLENCSISDVTIGKLKSTGNTQDGLDLVNTSNDISGLKIGYLITNNNGQFGTNIEEQDEGIYIENIQSSGNVFGLRALNARCLNINGGHITNNDTGLNTGPDNTGWLVNGLRVGGNVINGTLPADALGSNIIG